MRVHRRALLTGALALSGGVALPAFARTLRQSSGAAEAALDAAIDAGFILAADRTEIQALAEAGYDAA